jgi:MFS family permease
MFFLPLFFFKLEFPFWDQFQLTTLQEGMLNIAFLYGLERLVIFISAIPIAQLLTKFGIRHGFVMGHLTYALFVVLLYLSQSNPYLAFLAMFIEGLQINFFWNSYHYSLSRNSDRNKMGSNLGIIHFLLNLLAMISPALGGLIIASLGYSVLFLLGLVIILVGVVFAVLLDNVKVHDKISWKEFFAWMKEPGFRRLAATFAGRYFNDAIMTLWPLYLFVLLGTTESVGYLYSLSLFFAMIISYSMGSFLDKNKGKKPFFISGSLLSIIWLLRGFLVNIWTITIVNTLDKLTSSFHWLFFDRAWLLRGKGRQALSYFIYREMLQSLAGLLLWILVALLFFTFGAAWKSLFAIAGIGVLLTLLVREHKEAEVE